MASKNLVTIAVLAKELGLGLPNAVKTMLVESEWVEGRSLRAAEFLV